MGILEYPYNSIKILKNKLFHLISITIEQQQEYKQQHM